MQEHLIRLRRATALTGTLWLALVLPACGKGAPADAAGSGSEATSGAGAGGEGAKTSARSDGRALLDSIAAAVKSIAESDEQDPADSLGFVPSPSSRRGGSLGNMADIPGMVPGGECPPASADAATEIAAQATARIPLKVGLTLSHTWKADEQDYDHECLLQVKAVDERGIDVSSSCPLGSRRKISTSSRRLCRADLASSVNYFAETSPSYPATMRGSLEFSLSESSFVRLKTKGRVPHRFLDVASGSDSLLALDYDFGGFLKSDGPSTYKLIVNDTTVEMPTIEASLATGDELIKVRVLDDAHFPMMLDYFMPRRHFYITFTKISYPTEHTIEQHLAKDKKVDVYGIYFDFASDSLRVESEPVLREIATALNAHPDWKLTITGHTDSIGGDVANLELSRKRSARVRRALKEQFHIADSRLTTSGYGAGQPKDVNTTVEGRARNRRVELVRQ